MTKEIKKHNANVHRHKKKTLKMENNRPTSFLVASHSKDCGGFSNTLNSNQISLGDMERGTDCWLSMIHIDV